MRLRLRVFGHTLCSLTFDTGPALELEDEPPAKGITGGPDVYLERDPYPPVPSREEPFYEERKHFGF